MCSCREDTFVLGHMYFIPTNNLHFQFHDGVYLVLLMGLLEGYFVPMYNFHLTPTTFEQKVKR